VRALAMNQLTKSNTMRTIWREVSVAVLNGITIAILLGIGAGIVFQNPQLGGVIAAAMLINILVAGLCGVVVPIVLERAGQDPAVSSSVFVTMITDSMGFFVFLGLAVATGLTG
jgi:magnesium transporter